VRVETNSPQDTTWALAMSKCIEEKARLRELRGMERSLLGKGIQGNCHSS